MHRAGSRKGPLRAGELAEAVVLADLTLVLSILSQVLPFLGGALLVIAIVPMAAIAARNRLRAVMVGAIAASTVGFLVLGTPVVTTVLACAALGAVVGGAARRGWGLGRTVGAAVLFLWPLAAAVIDGFLWLFSANRKLVLVQIRNSWQGARRMLLWLSDHLTSLAAGLNFDPAVRHMDDFVTRFLRYWWLSIPLVVLFLVVATAGLAQRITAPTLRRVRAAFATGGDVGDQDEVGDQENNRENEDATGKLAPVPVALRNVSVRYPEATDDALRAVSLEVGPAELVAIVGSNGSGKSTLARVLAGRRPTAGEVVRPGSTGLGRPGGTAIVFQRPELQVLGVRVRDDIVWGLPEPRLVDVAAVLDRVGLRSFAERETSTLSGGELQRLALAAALARRPQLLISDESTAMVDSIGRQQLVGLLRSMVTDDGIAVVHVTHNPAETDVADRTIMLEHGRVVPLSERVPSDPIPLPTPGPPARKKDGPLFLLRGVGHEYSRRTPWAHRALSGIDLRIDHGEAVLVVGHNGSGKSTLAWVLAGLLHPSEGEARLEGQTLTSVVGQVGVAFQHARLQLLRPTVGAEVSAASGASNLAAWQALRAVGLDPQDLGPRRVDELSGGQARRVVLAGAIAARPRALVLDEPFAGLDDHGRAELSAALVRLRTERGLTLVCVSHDRDLPPALVDREVELLDGRIAYDGPGREDDHDIARGNLS
ncbi:MAG: energy-coupling factor transport system ATP-binding protein [Actinomycetota bacterium]|nr:energy-coupling factor transport system ATP-binding protein [Actinomycetota bacterium]